MASPMASMAELTAQVVALTDQVATLMTRVAVAEQNVTMSAQGPRNQMSGDSGIFDKKKLYPKELKENTSFRTWSERFIAWVSMDDADIGRAFLRAGKQDQTILFKRGFIPISVTKSKACIKAPKPIVLSC